MRRLYLIVLTSFVMLDGCHSAFVHATVRNESHDSISLVEVDYPSASFGVQSLSPSAELHYRFKVLGTGQLKITYTDHLHQEHAATGPLLHEGHEGTLDILVTEHSVDWQSHLMAP